MLKLILLGPGKKREYFLRGSLTIGRGTDNAIIVGSTTLSRSHARVDLVGGAARVIDLGSRNGTFVGGNRVEEQDLVPGDQIRCGEAILELVKVELPRRVDDLQLADSSEMVDLSRRTIASLVAAPVAPGSDGVNSSRRMEIVLKVSEVLSSPEPIDVLLQKVLDLVAEIFTIDRASLFLRDESGALVARAVKNRLSHEDGPVGSTSIVSWVMENAKAGMFRDARFDERVGKSASIAVQSIRSAMCVPLRAKEEMLGALYVDNLTRLNPFAKTDLDLLAAFGNQAAIAIENATLYERLEREAVARNNLSRFFPPAVFERLSSEGSQLATVDTKVTALFADICGYTDLCATMEPRSVVALLREYFPEMAAIVFEYGGTLEKYIGDALLAVWGAPFAQSEDADRAVSAALAMQDAVAGLNVVRGRRGEPPIAIHIGAHTGVVTAGNIGSERYLQYATIGDATNMASRICGVAQAGEVVVSEATLQECKTLTAPATSLGMVTLKGKEQPLHLYRLQTDPRSLR